MTITIITAFILSALVGVYADSKNRFGVGYFVLSLIVSPIIPFIILAIAGDKRK